MSVSIPTVHTDDRSLNQALAALKQNVEHMTGQTRSSPKLQELPPTATLAQVIEQLNAITRRLT